MHTYDSNNGKGNGKGHDHDYDRGFDRLVVKVSSSIANLGPGFDVFSLALGYPYDMLTFEVVREEEVRLKVVGPHQGAIPLEPELNTAGLVAGLFIKKYGLDLGFSVSINKGIPPGFGLGSSGADAAATAYVLNHMLNLGLSTNELISLAAQGEVAASGVAHADNVSASFLGGFNIVSSYDPINVLNHKPPDNLGICIIRPDIRPPERKTEYARRILPEKVKLDQLAINVGHASSLVFGMLTGDIYLIGRSMDDKVVEPARSRLIPGFESLRESALNQGASGVAICGSGPSVVACYDTDKENPKAISRAMAQGLSDLGIGSETIITSPGRGIDLIEDENKMPQSP